MSERLEKARQYILEGDVLTDHDEKHIRRLRKEVGEVVKIYEKLIDKHSRHGWYPDNPEERALMEAATKQIIKERSAVIRAAKRLLRLIG